MRVSAVLSSAAISLLAVASPIPFIASSLKALQPGDCGNTQSYLWCKRGETIHLDFAKLNPNLPRALNITSSVGGNVIVVSGDSWDNDDNDYPNDPDDNDNDDDNDSDDDDGDVIPEAFLEMDSDSGGESDMGNDAVSVANGLTGTVGAGSSALNNKTQGSTSSTCSLLACTSAAQSDGKVSTTASEVRISNFTGPLIKVTGPLVVVSASRNTSH